ncbi:MAG: YegP family protein [Myxococcota bacterium]
MAAKFELYTDKGGEFRFRLKAGNGENILSSEGYSAKSGCKNGIESVKKNAAMDERYEIKENSGGKHYFMLKAGNHEVIGTSQPYASMDGAKKGIEAVKRAAAEAEMEEV